jgi:hypothetical protein
MNIIKNKIKEIIGGNLGVFEDLNLEYINLSSRFLSVAKGSSMRLGRFFNLPILILLVSFYYNLA